MANTYVNLATTTLGSEQATVTFSSISQTYTDLVIRASLRVNQGGTFGGFIIKAMDANTLYSWTRLWGGGNAGTSSNKTSSASDWTQVSGESVNASSSTATTFSTHEFYFPSYAGSLNKVATFQNFTETNGLNAYISTYAALVRSTSAITSITFSSNGFVAGSTFYLYGIKNS